MPITPSGIFNNTLMAVRDLLCASSTWQTWCGAEDADEAQANTALWMRSRDDSTDPECTIDTEDAIRSTQGPGTALSGGTIVVLIFEADFPGEYTADNERLIWMANQVGAIVADMEALHGLNQYARVRSFASTGPSWNSPMRTEDDDVTAGERLQMVVRVAL